MVLGIPFYYVVEGREYHSLISTHNKDGFGQYIPPNQVVVVLSIVPKKLRVEVMTATHGVGWVLPLYMRPF